MFSSLGPLEIVLIIVVLLLVFGPKRLPSIGRSLGTGLREFKDSITGEDKRRDQDDAPERPALSEPPAAEPPAAEPPAAATASRVADAAPDERA